MIYSVACLQVVMPMAVNGNWRVGYSCNRAGLDLRKIELFVSTVRCLRFLLRHQSDVWSCCYFHPARGWSSSIHHISDIIRSHYCFVMKGVVLWLALFLWSCRQCNLSPLYCTAVLIYFLILGIYAFRIVEMQHKIRSFDAAVSIA